MLHFMEILSNVLLCFVVMHLCKVKKGVPDLFVITLLYIFIFYCVFHTNSGAWGGVVVKALRY